MIITSGILGSIGFARISAYVAAEHGQVGLVRAAVEEVTDRRIRVDTLHPGPTSTAFQDASRWRRPVRRRPRPPAVSDGLTPLGRHATPREIAQAELHRASDASAMVTSTTSAIDGGLSG